MKFCCTFSFLVSFYSLGQADSSKVIILDSVEYTITEVPISHYSGIFGDLRSSGHILEDSLGNTISNSMYCRSFEDPTIFYYQLTKYFPTGTVSYDSIVDFRKKRIAKSTVEKFNSKGQKIQSRIIRATLDPKRNNIPIRSETRWNGVEIYYDNEGRKTTKKKIENAVY